MTWVDCTSSLFGGFARDMGPYTGTWPMQATPVTAGLNAATSDEIDLVVGLPNPAHPGDPLYAFDGSYASPIWRANRYMNSGTPPPDSYTDYLRQSVGGAAVPAATDVPPAGAHLWVVAYVGSPYAAPSIPPESYVPASYAAGGTAPEPAGEWSAWQTGFTLTKTVTPVSGSSWNGTATATESDPHPNTAFSTMTDKLLGDAKRPIVASTGGATGGNLFDFAASRNAPTTIDTTGHTQISLNNLDQLTTNWDGAPTNPYPTPLDSLVAGVDYDTAPFIGQAWEYESPDPVSWSWPATMHVETGGAWFTGYPTGDAATARLSAQTHVTVTVLDAPVVNGATEPSYGTEIASILVSTTDASTSVLRTVTLPNDLGVVFTLAAQTQMVEGPGTGWDPAASPDFGGTGVYDWVIQFLFGDDVNGNSLDFTWTTTRWRYWIPAGGPVLKTVGESFLAGNGEAFRVKSLIPGYGWVPVQRYG